MAKKSKKTTTKPVEESVVEKTTPVVEVKEKNVEEPVKDEKNTNETKVTATTSKSSEPVTVTSEKPVVEEENKECACEKGKCTCGEGSEKTSFFKKSWKYVVTGVTCAAVSVGITLGADAAKVQETLTKAQANQVAIAAATYSAEQVLTKVGNIKDAESKKKAINEVITEVNNAMPEFIKAATAVKETAKDVKENIKETVENVKK